MHSLSTPLSRGAALFLTLSDTPKPGISSISAADHDVSNPNIESTGRPQRWIAGERMELQRLRSQVGSGFLPDGH